MASRWASRQTDRRRSATWSVCRCNRIRPCDRPRPRDPHVRRPHHRRRGVRRGLGAQLIHADDVSTLHPLLEPDGILAALHVPSDLYFEPSQVAIGLVLAAARAGAAFVPEAEVSGIRRDGDRVTGVETNRGTFSAGVVVDAAGAWAGQLAALAGVRIPLVPMRHQLFITQPLAGVLPACR